MVYPINTNLSALLKDYPQRLTLGHAVSGHAGPHRGTRPGYLRHHARYRGAGLAGQATARLCRAGRGPARRLRADLVEGLLRALTEERDEREEFVVEACYLMRDRFRGEEVFETLGLNVKAAPASSTTHR